MSKYQKLDTRVFNWLKKHREGITTAKVFKALRITDPVAQRHISRRFTHLEDRGVLVCTLQRTMRICKVIKDPPVTLSKKRQKTKLKPFPEAVSPIIGIPAEDSTQFELAGGKIQRLDSHWNKHGCDLPLGSLTFLDYIATLD